MNSPKSYFDAKVSSDMANPYEVRIPLRTEGISLPEIEVDRLKVRETSRSRHEERRIGDKDFELVANFEAEPEEKEKKRTEMHRRSQRLAQIISFLTNRGVIAETPMKTYRADNNIQVTAESGTTNIPSDWGDFFVDIYESIDDTDEIGESVMRALRWYATGLASEHHTDRFLSFWLALEIQAESQRKDPEEIDPEVDKPVEQAMEVVREEVKSNKVKMRVNQYISERIRDESIPEAVAREIQETLNENHPRVPDKIEGQMKDFQRDRSNLVHHGESIDDVKSKAGTLESYNKSLLKRKLDPIFSGEYDSNKFPDAAIVDRVTSLQIILADHPDGLTEEELRKEAFAATRDFRKAAEIIGLTTPIHELEDIVEERRNDETVYKLNGTGPIFVCPVCDEEFKEIFLLTRHLTDTDAEDVNDKRDYHTGEHGTWREKQGLAKDNRELWEVDSWAHENREELRK